MAAIEAMEKGAGGPRDEALAIEAAAFAKVAKTPTAHALVSVFLGDQAVKKIAKKHAKAARPVKRAAVLGAGIMGGGISYQSASKGVPVLMKDIAPKALEPGIGEAVKLLEKQVDRGKLTTGQMAKVLAGITPTLSYGDFGAVDLVVEAVVENEGVKKKVLAEVEGLLPGSAILTSNTSTISITRLADRPEAAGELLRDALLQPGAAHAARRGDPRREVEPGGDRHRRGLCPGPGQDARSWSATAAASS